MAYVFRPRKVQADIVAGVVKELQAHVPELKISVFCEFALDKAVSDAAANRHQFAAALRMYLATKRRRDLAGG